jgi:hypothetical protein
MLQPGWLINNKYLFLTVLEAESPRSKAPLDSVFGKGPLLCSYTSSGGLTWKEKAALWGLSHKDTISVHEVVPS